jgi:acetoacetyl-CoA synthetase
MPICFLDDRDGASYRSAYFDEYPAVWRHGDFVTLTAEGDLIFLGRSDATLKPAGVRVATADIYAALERVPLVVQSMAVGYSPPGAQSEKVILFVVLANGSTLDEALCNEIRRVLRESNAFYVPALILQAPQLPRTTNSKLSEISVKRALAGKDPGNLSALANPESLSFFLCEGLRAVRTALG